MNMSAKVNPLPLVSPAVAETMSEAKSNLGKFISSIPGLSKGLEGSGIESHAGVMSLDDKSNLFNGATLMDRFKDITESVTADSGSVLSLMSGVGKFNDFISGITQSFAKMDGGKAIIDNLREAGAMLKENIVDRLLENFKENESLVENDGGFSDLDEVQQEDALMALLDQDSEQIARMLESIEPDNDEGPQISDFGAGKLLGLIANNAMINREQVADVRTIKTGLTLPGA